MASPNDKNPMSTTNLPRQRTFTPAQHIVLSNQVLALKLYRESIKRQIPCVLPQEWIPHCCPPALNAPPDNGPLPRAITKEEGDRIRLIMAQKAHHRQQQQQQQQQQQKGSAAGAAAAAASSSKGRPTIELPPPPEPLYTIEAQSTAIPVQMTGGTNCLEPIAIEMDVGELIRAENQRMMDLEMQKKMLLLDAALRNPTADPGMKFKSAAPPLGAALLELRMLRALNKQRELRAVIDLEANEIMAMKDKDYNQLRRSHRSSLIENARKEFATRADIAASNARDVKAFLSDGMKEYNQGVKDLKVARNRALLRAHERLARERNRLKEDDRTLRMAALKAHDFEAYQEMLRRQAGSTPAADARYEAISKFLADTEAYLNRLANKIASVKVTAEASSAAARARDEARARGLSEEEVQAAATAAAAEAATGSETLREAAEGAVDAQSRYYALAHSMTEEIVDQPRLLRPPGNAHLREYQIVGLQWMVSLYNNHLNGILADEMGLGKTVQVMALIAYLMEKKANYGPHLIIVPNAVMVNWKSELTQWLPSARCVYYVGGKDERARKYTAEVQPLQFNVLVTTYEFIMRDRAKLSKIDWQYIVIDEAQRMKDRQSKLAKDLDRFTAVRRLLLSGTPLQNDLQELWSLLNLLLPDVFDDKKVFQDWFGDFIGGGGGGGNSAEDWLATEKRVVVIHRLHQILEPFMLRRQVEDVESKLPSKIAHTVRVPMSAHQSMVYTWVKTTGTLRLDPSAPTIGKVQREFASLNNKCMELRKLCNHPMLSYPPPHWGVGEMIVRQCGKLVTLDRMLVKLKASGHRVLLFSTMTKLLDLLEVYLQWRQLPESMGGGKMKYLRIDGSTSLEDRETSIQKFNAPNSEAFVFLLSIRAAGRGLNLQSSDTVVIYDPDPNPKNEEQAIARSHRIGQTKDVRVFHLEAVTDAAPAASVAPEAIVPQKQQQQQQQPTAAAAASNGGGNGSEPLPNAAAPTSAAPGAEKAPENSNNNDGKSAAATVLPAPNPDETPRRLYGDSIESVLRNTIQRIKIEMANEVIDAGRFDQQTSNEERRTTLETLLQDQDRALQAVNSVPTDTELNKMLARGDAEMELFERMDKEPGVWFEPSRLEEVPYWMRWNEKNLRAALEEQSKHKVDIEAELAALTGTVLHHHQATAGDGGKGGKKKNIEAGAVAANVNAVAAPKGVVPMEIERPPVAEPAMTTTTTRSFGRDDDDYDEVGMVDNDEEEEEVLEQNLANDATTTVSGGGGDSLTRIPSTAAMPRMMSPQSAPPATAAATAAAATAAAAAGDGEPAAKRRRALSVHFEDEPMEDLPPLPSPGDGGEAMAVQSPPATANGGQQQQ